MRLPRIFRRGRSSVERLKFRLQRFRELVQKNDRVLKLIAEAGAMSGGEYLFDSQYLRTLAEDLQSLVNGVVHDLSAVTGEKQDDLLRSVETIDGAVLAAMELRPLIPEGPLVLPMETVGLEHRDEVGEKMARLGEVRNRLGLTVPDGFVVSTRACWEFLRKAGVAGDLPGSRTDPGDEVPLKPEDAEGLRRRILDAELPGDLTRSIQREIKRMGGLGEAPVFAVRSSATEEDGDLLSPGQYATLLGVLPEDVPAAYKKVIASLFTPDALAYQRDRGLPPGQGLMAVGCLAMVAARSSGVVYSLDPLRPDREVQLVAAAWGLGPTVVEGAAPVDRFALSRSPDRVIRFRSIAEKSRRLAVAPGGGIQEETVPAESVGSPCVSDLELRALSETACRIERYMKRAQDVEWAMDDGGRVVVLQARPLRLQAPLVPPGSALRAKLEKHTVIMKGQGEVACRGIASGIVKHTKEADFQPPVERESVVLVAPSASPALGARLRGVSAVVTDVGNATGHFAAVAREARIPTIVDTGDGTSILEEGREVTVDAEENVIYAGRVEELLHYQLMRSASYEDSPEFRALRRMLRRIAPLHLHDPEDRRFAPDHCRTYHDVIRFAHERAVSALTGMEWVQPTRGLDYVHRLKLPIPLDLTVVDLGGGVRALPGERKVELHAVECRPLRLLLEVLSGEGGWATAPADMDLKGFMSSATRAIPLTSPLSANPDQNLALVSGEYLHLSLRLGYHFNVVDTFLTEEPNDNYIYFRFLGGVTEIVRRSRRAVLLRRILERFGFVVEGRGDLVIGRTRGLKAEQMEERIRMLGRLIGYTRQLDIHLRDDRKVDEHLVRFLEGSKSTDHA